MTRILIVDDDPGLRELMTVILADEGYVVAAAADGHAALRRLATFAPDLLITDLQMPGLDGWRLVRKVRGRYPTLPVLIISATVVPQPPGDTALTARTLILDKPFGLDELLACIRQIIAPPAGGAGPELGR
jgi:CheY-like chemotaxis protein